MPATSSTRKHRADMQDERDAGELSAIYRGVSIGQFRVVAVPVDGAADLPAGTRTAFGISEANKRSNDRARLPAAHLTRAG
jgi:hypothetical protein